MNYNSVNWEEIEQKSNIINAQLMDPSLEMNKRIPLLKEQSHLSQILMKYNEIKKLELEIKNILTQKEGEKDIELISLYDEELAALKSGIEKISLDLEELIFPPNELDSRPVFLEIRAGAGGQEASLFAGDLLRMYSNYALKKNWQVSLASESETDLGGYREVILHIKGKGVFGYLKHESGVHRVQRVPLTETQGRVHTSTATVAVLPEADEVDITINPADLKIDVYRASGAGGQHVNKTDSAVRITHLPTGVVVTCQEDRSQIKNRAKAMKMLQSRLLVAEQEKQQSEMSQKRKELVGTGMRSEKVRTYNFPQNRITDHQINLTLNRLDYVINGDLDEIIDGLRARDKQERYQNPLFSIKKS